MPCLKMTLPGALFVLCLPSKTDKFSLAVDISYQDGDVQRHFPLRVSPTTTVNDLKMELLIEFGVEVEHQKLMVVFCLPFIPVFFDVFCTPFIPLNCLR